MRALIVICIFFFASFFLAACGSSESTDGACEISPPEGNLTYDLKDISGDKDLTRGTDQGEYFYFINRTSDSWQIEYGAGTHSDQYTINGRSTGISPVLNPPSLVYMGWQGSGSNQWSQLFGVGSSVLNVYGHNNNPHCANEIIDSTVAGDIWMCPDDKYSVKAAILYMSPPRHQGKGYWGYVEFRDKITLPSYSDWMSSLSDDLTIGDLSIPGSHDSASWNMPQVAETQHKTFIQQMEWGARVFDLRLSENMNFFHGSYYCGTNLEGFFNEAFSFLESHPGEFLITMVKGENCEGATFTDNFESVINSLPAYRAKRIVRSRDILSLKLSELRNTIVIVTRKNDYPGTCGYVTGAPQINWPDDASQFPTSTSGCAYCIPVGVSDYYSGLPRDKMGKGGLLEHFRKASVDTGRNWFIGFTSGYDLGGACFSTPVCYAQAIHPALWQYLLGGPNTGDGYVRLTSDWASASMAGWISTISPAPPSAPDRNAKLGTVMMDYLGDDNTNDIRQDLIERNFR